MRQFKSSWNYNSRGEVELETESVMGIELEDEEIDLAEFEIADRTSNDSELDDDEILVDESDEYDIAPGLGATILEGKDVDSSL